MACKILVPQPGILTHTPLRWKGRILTTGLPQGSLLIMSVHLCMCSVISDSLWPHDYSPPGFSVHGISQAWKLEWVVTSSSRGSPQPRDWTCVSFISCTGRWVLYHFATWEALPHPRTYTFLKKILLKHNHVNLLHIFTANFLLQWQSWIVATEAL